MGRYCVVVRTDSGEAVSWASANKVAPREVLEAKGLEVVDLGEQPEGGPDLAAHRWDPKARRLVAAPQRDRLDDIQTAPELAELAEVEAALPPAQRAKLRRGLERLLGPVRFRRDGDPVPLG